MRSSRRSAWTSLAVDFDMVAFAGLNAEIGADLAVDCDPAGGDQFIAMPARTEPGRGEETIKAHEELSGWGVEKVRGFRG